MLHTIASKRWRSGFFAPLLCIIVLAVPGSWNALSAQSPASQATVAVAPENEPDRDYLRIAKLLYADDFRSGISNWVIETEKEGGVRAEGGTLDINVPGGATLWFKHELQGPILIEYEATVIAAGGPNDRVSDLNCFWMATDPRTPRDLFAHPHHGAFSEYNTLLTYYVGLGGNYNRTTRFRRYIGSPTERPLLPGNDLSSPENLIQPNRMQTIRLVANGSFIAYYRDQMRLFVMHDPEPYTRGWFAIRTTKNHLQARNLRIYQLKPGPQ